MQKLTVLAVIRPERRCVPARFRQSASRTTPFPLYYIVSSSSMFIAVGSLPGARYVEDKSTKVNCFGCDTSYIVLHSTFSSIRLKDNSVYLLLHSHFFLNGYRGRVAAWCQVCRRQICKSKLLWLWYVRHRVVFHFFSSIRLKDNSVYLLLQP